MSSTSAERVKILDGGLSTELERLGFTTDNDPLWTARWLVKDPNALTYAHTSFLDAGSDIIETASYQASIQSLCDHAGVSVERAKSIIRSSVTIAKQARDSFWHGYLASHDTQGSQQRDFPLVAGSVGPFGACQHDGSEYTGQYIDNMSIEELMDWHRPRLRCLVEAGVDLIAFETIPAAKEGRAIIKLLREFPNVEAWLSFSCKDNTSVSYGDSFSSVVKMCSTEAPPGQLVAVGVNCLPSENISQLLHAASNVKGRPSFIAYPNKGERWSAEKGWEINPERRKLMYTSVLEWIQKGARWIGGCCRITAEDIAYLREIVYGVAKP